MFRYKILMKQYGFLILILALAIIALLVWVDNVAWITNQCKALK